MKYMKYISDFCYCFNSLNAWIASKKKPTEPNAVRIWATKLGVNISLITIIPLTKPDNEVRSQKLFL